MATRDQFYAELMRLFQDAISSLVELSTPIREARMIMSEITARTEPLDVSFKDTYKDDLAGVGTPSELEEPGLDPYSHFALPVLAIQSGGLVLDELSDIWRSIEHCVEDARLCYTMSFDTRRMQLSRTNITTSRYKSEHVDYLHARTPAITISRFSRISSTSLPGKSVFTN
jgi:hypothetical protein